MVANISTDSRSGRDKGYRLRTSEDLLWVGYKGSDGEVGRKCSSCVCGTDGLGVGTVLDLGMEEVLVGISEGN